VTVVVAAVTKNEGIIIASDSEFTYGWQKGNLEVPKIWVEDSVVFGACGSVRGAQIARHLTEWPEQWPTDGSALDIERFGVKVLVPQLRTAMTDNGALKIEHSVEEYEIGLLICWGSFILEVDPGGSVTPHGQRGAIGSGYAEALGALGETGPWTRAQVVAAVRRASETAVGVGGPVYVASTKKLVVQEA
jgi:20S proteasome alpha/beta subunit